MRRSFGAGPVLGPDRVLSLSSSPGGKNCDLNHSRDDCMLTIAQPDHTDYQRGGATFVMFGYQCSLLIVERAITVRNRKAKSSSFHRTREIWSTCHGSIDSGIVRPPLSAKSLKD